MKRSSDLPKLLADNSDSDAAECELQWHLITRKIRIERLITQQSNTICHYTSHFFANLKTT